MLAVFMLFISFTALAKDATPKSCPEIEANATDKSGDAKETPLQLPLPVRIVEEPPESDDAKSRAANTSSHEDQDLKAQQSMAISADSQLMATYVIIFLSFIGTCLLIWTVAETRKTANAAWRSVDISEQAITVARETAEKQLGVTLNVALQQNRPWIMVTPEYPNGGHRP